jgi:hypothetical protein
MSVAEAKKLFTIFHQFEPIKVGDFGKSFKIPREAIYVGAAKIMYYTSDKLNPETGEDEGNIPYYHEHSKGARTYVTDESRDGDLRPIPKWIYAVDALVKLGTCDGFVYEDSDGETREAKATGRKPDWYATPSGKAILAIQDKRTVLAIVWGGQLRVEWRGVVG